MTTTDILGYVTISNQKHLVFGNGFTDGSRTELQIYFRGSPSGLGKDLDGQSLQEIYLQASDGSILTTCDVADENGGVIQIWRGNERHFDDVWNLEVPKLNIKLKTAYKLYVNTAD